MAYSKITITFDSMPSVADILNFRETTLGLNFLETFRAKRLGQKEVTIPLEMVTYDLTFSNTASITDIGIRYAPNESGYVDQYLSSFFTKDNLDGTLTVSINSIYTPSVVRMSTSAIITWEDGDFATLEGYYSGYVSQNYRGAFNSDYNLSSLFTVIATNGVDGSGLGQVVITATYPNAIFEEISKPVGTTIVIENIVNDVLIIEDINFTQATTNGKCSHYKVNVTTDKTAVKVTLNGVVLTSSNTANPFSFEILRGQTWKAIFEDADGETATHKSTNNPINLNEGIFNFVANYAPNGGTITVNPKVDTSSLVLEYSLDGSSWQNSNVFSGILAGSYNVYVRDQYGCSFFKTLEIDEAGNEREPYFLISKSNAIQFAERVIWNECSLYKNDENTLSCEADVELPYQEIQQFQSCDAITTQIKSNYNEISATIVKRDEEIPLSVEKMTNNMNLRDRRDARMYALGSGFMGVYFISGKIRDFDSGAETGDYVLNGGLPSWAQRDTYVRIGTDWFKISDIFFDDTKSADVLVIESNYAGADEAVQISSIYNLFNYEVYEFSILMSAHLNENFQVRINNNDANFGSLTHLSEVINVKEKQKNTIAINYRASHNTDIFYATGIEFILRLPINKINGKLFDESEPYRTDTTAVLLNVELHELNEFEFEPVTKQMMWKLVQALSHDIIKIDGVGYVKNGTIEVDGPLERTNLYIVKATMIKTGSTFNERSDNNYTGMPGNENIDIPALIDSGNGYVIYR